MFESVCNCYVSLFRVLLWVARNLHRYFSLPLNEWSIPLNYSVSLQTKCGLSQGCPLYVIHEGRVITSVICRTIVWLVTESHSENLGTQKNNTMIMKGKLKHRKWALTLFVPTFHISLKLLITPNFSGIYLYGWLNILFCTVSSQSIGRKVVFFFTFLQFH
jgi:hypothetical protein